MIRIQLPSVSLLLVISLVACSSPTAPTDITSTPPTTPTEITSAPQPTSTSAGPIITLISIDGDPSDWADKEALITDPQGDNAGGGFDIATIRAFTNDQFLYILIESYGPRQDYVQVDLDVVTNNRRFVVSIQPERCWAGHIGETTSGSWEDIGDVAGAITSGREAVEYKIPLSTFGDFTDLQLGVRPMGGECCGTKWHSIDETGLAHVPRSNEFEPEPVAGSLTYNPCGAPVIEQSFDLTQARGDEPHDIVISPDGLRAYTLSRGTHLIFVIDLTTNQVSAAIDLFTDARSPFGPGPDALALTPDGSLLLVANQLDSSVMFIDTASNAIVVTLPAPNFMMDVAVSPDGKVAYAVGHGEDRVMVIDLTTRQVSSSIPLPGNRVRPYAVAFTPDGSRAYVGTESGTLYRIDPKTHKVVAQIRKPATGWSNGSLVIAPDGNTAFLSSFEGKWVGKFDLKTDQLVQSLENVEPQALAFNPDGSLLFMGRGGFFTYSEEGHYLVALDPVSLDVVGEVDIVSPAPQVAWPNDIQGMAFTPDGSRLYAAVVDSDGIYMVETAKMEATGFIPLTAFARYRPGRVVISPDGARLYVADYYPQPATISVVNLSSGVIETIQSDRPGACAHSTRGLALSLDGAQLYAATAGHCILVIDTQNGKVTDSFLTGGVNNLTDMAIAPGGDRAYAVDDSGALYILDLENRTSLTTLENVIWGASYIKVSPDGLRAYITGRLGYAIVDLVSNTILHTLPDFSQGSQAMFSDYDLRQIGITPDSSQYVVGEFTSMHVYEAANFREMRHIDLFEWVPAMPLSADILFSPDGKTGFLAMWDEKAILVFDVQGWQRTAAISVGRAPYFCVCPRYFAMSPDGEMLYVACEQSDNVIAIDTTTNQVVDTISLLK